MSAAPRVLFSSPLSPHGGYGNDGIGIARALYRSGWDVTLRPGGVQVPLPQDIAGLLTKAIEPPYDLFLDHAPTGDLGLKPGEQKFSPLRVAWTMAEATEFAQEHVGPKNFSGYTTVIGYDDWSVEAISKVFDGEVMKLQGGFSTEDWETPEPIERDWHSSPFIFGMVGSMTFRKNPFAAIRAFERVHEKHPDTVLFMKDSTGALHPQIQERWDGVKLFSRTMHPRELQELYGRMHCLLAPSFGEGKNLPALEAQAMGTPVIASDCAGHREWAAPSSTWLTPGTMVNATDPFAGQWLKVDEDALYEQMLEAVENRTQTRLKGQMAQSLVQSKDWSKVIETLRIKLRHARTDHLAPF